MEDRSVTVVRPMRPEDAGAARRAQYEGWRDAYVRPDGVSTAWLEEVWRPRLSEAGIAEFAAEVAEGQHCPRIVQLVAELDDGAGPEVVGLAIALAPEKGPQELRVLYVASRARGRGVGSALMDAVLAHMDLTRPVSLGVAAFNEDARRFYRRFGFREVRGLESEFAGVIPEVTMTRRAAVAR